MGNTLTGTSTVSSPVGYLTVALTFKSVAPTLTLSVGTSLLMSASVTGVKFPPLSGVIASLTSAGFGWVPSNVYTVFVSEPNTLIVTGIVVLYVFPSTI